MKPALILLATLLAACGSKSGRIPLHIAIAGPGLQPYSLPVTLAGSLGYFTEQGLDVTIETLPSLGKALHALVGGSVDAAGVAYSQVLQINAEGQRLRTFFVMTRRDSVAILVAPHASDRIRRAEDLKGAMIGVPSIGTSAHMFTNYYLAAHGIQPAGFNTIGIGTGATAIAAIESGRIDAAAVAGGDHLVLRRRHPQLRILIDASTVEAMRELYGSDAYASGALSARPEWLAANPDSARRLTRALVRSHQWLASHSPEEILEITPASSRSAHRESDLEILRFGIAALTPAGRMPDGAPEVMLRYIRAAIPSTRDAKIDLPATWTNAFLDSQR